MVTLFVVATSSTVLPRIVCAASVAPEILAFYYGWYGNPQISGEWRHWKNVDPVNKRVENVTDFPAYGTYDSHDPAVVDRQAGAARGAGLTGFIASWWGHDSFEDRGMPLLLVTAGKHNLSVSAYYEKIAGDDAASRIKAAVGDINYLLTQYGTRHGCARAASRSCSFTTEGSLLPPAPELATVLVAAVLGADRLVRSVELGPLGRREIPIADNLEIGRGPRLFGSEFV